MLALARKGPEQTSADGPTGAHKLSPGVEPERTPVSVPAPTPANLAHAFGRIRVYNEAPGRLMRKCSCGGKCSKCAGGSEEIEGLLQRKPRLSVGPADDRFEQEANRIESQVTRTSQPASMDAGPALPAIQPYREGPTRAEPLLNGAEESAVEGRTGGSALPDGLRHSMEHRLGADFSSVRIHSGAESEQMNERLHAHAFTFGSHIWLGAGQSASNAPLMAHELTHVVQQSPHLMRSRRPEAAPAVIQRKNDYYSLPNDKGRRGAGTRTHDRIFGEIAKENPGLLVEVNIPGGKKGATSEFQSGEGAIVGRADFYHAPTTIGVKFAGDDPVPQYLESSRDLKVAGDASQPGLQRFDHAGKAAPVAKTRKMPEKALPTTCPGLSAPALCRMDTAPREILLGDLKPSDEAERRDGVSQLGNYIRGINDTATQVNQFARDNPNRVDPRGASWHPVPGTFGKSQINIPAKYKYPSTEGKKIPVVEYREGKVVTNVLEPAYLYVVPDPDPAHAGIWFYEYVPADRHYDVTRLREAQAKALKDLNDPVIKELKSKPDVLDTKRKPGPAPISPGPLRIQRKLAVDKLDYTKWKKDFQGWQQGDAKPYLDSAAGKKSESLDILLEIKKRSSLDLPVPAGAEEIGAGLHKIEHWHKFGAEYGWLRNTFGTIYTRFVDLYEKARDKFRSLLPKTPGRTVGGGTKAAVIRIGIKILKYAAHFIIGRVTENLTQAFQHAAENLIDNLFGDVIADLDKQIDEIREYIADFESLIKQSILDVVKNAIGDYSGFIEKIGEVVGAVQEVTTWANRARLAAEVAGCLFPEPVIGCLWSVLGGELLDQIIAEIIEQCWFRRDIMFPILRATKFVSTDLPNKITNLLIDGLMSVLPRHAKELIGDVRMKDTGLTDAEACKDLAEEEPVPPPTRLPQSMRGDGSAMTPAELAYLQLNYKWGSAVKAVGEMLQVSGVSSNIPLDLGKINRIDQFLSNIKGNTKAIRDFIASMEENRSAKKISFEEIIDLAENQILHPAVILNTPSAPPTPRERPWERNEGIVIKRF